MEESRLFELILEYRLLIAIPLLLLQGPVMALVLGFMASSGYFNLYYLIPLVVVADLTNDVLLYNLGRWGRWKLVARYGSYVGLTSERIEKTELFIEDKGLRALVIAKFSYGLGIPTMFLMGLSRMKFSRFITINFFTSLPKSIILVSLGYFFGKNIDLIQQYLGYIGIVGAVVLLFIFYKFFRRQKT